MSTVFETPASRLELRRELPAQGILRLLGAARMFSLALEQLVESKVQQEVAGGRLSRTQWKLLEVFALTDVHNVTDLAAFQGVSTAAASKAADRLVRLGLLTREEDQEDRRHIRLELSAEGQRLTREYLSALDQRLLQVFAPMNTDDLNRMAKELDTVVSRCAVSREELQRLCLQCGVNRREPCLLLDEAGIDCSFGQHRRPQVRPMPADGIPG